MDGSTPAEIGRRIRAALVLAGRTPMEVAPELNISPRTLDRTIAGQRSAREWELQRLADLLDVPRWFLTTGFDDMPVDEAGQAVELRALDEKIDREIIPRLDALLSGTRLGAAEATRAAAAAAKQAEDLTGPLGREAPPRRKRGTG